jgi:hypothetical protein
MVPPSSPAGSPWIPPARTVALNPWPWGLGPGDAEQRALAKHGQRPPIPADLLGRRASPLLAGSPAAQASATQFAPSSALAGRAANRNEVASQCLPHRHLWVGFVVALGAGSRRWLRLRRCWLFAWDSSKALAQRCCRQPMLRLFQSGSPIRSAESAWPICPSDRRLICADPAARCPRAWRSVLRSGKGIT